MKLLFLVSLIAAVSAVPIDNSFQNIDDIGYYMVVDSKKTWQDALQYCYSLDSHLATVNSPEEAEVLQKLLNEHEVPYYAHIGFSNLENKGYFITVEGKINLPVYSSRPIILNVI